MTWQIIDPSKNIWKPQKEGDEIIGFLLKVENDVGKFKSKVYRIENANHEQVVIFGSTILDDLMSFVRIGSYIRITFKGTQPSKSGADTKLFEVAYNDEPIDLVSME